MKYKSKCFKCNKDIKVEFPEFVNYCKKCFRSCFVIENQDSIQLEGECGR